ncbi:Ig-like domain-containing protein [uncultured Jatrophihabitans sp.]|uniref:L,D-transpeptidase n=1 Tax=uncultured Jatrophihabitans sp. TaxID=1610747 RepID=UPI0035CB47C5
MVRDARPTRWARWLVPAAVVAVGIAGCSSAHNVSATRGSGVGTHHASGSDGAAGTSATPHVAAKVLPATVSTVPAAGAKKVDPTQRITVSVAHGTLRSVKVTNPAGKTVTGAAAGSAGWRSNEDLGYGRTYTVVATGVGADGAAVTKRSSFTTVDPDNTVDANINRIGGYALTNGATYGVAIVPIVHFDSPITGKAARAAVVKTLSVTTTPHVAGAWAWYGTQDVHYRPQSYWPSGTRVTVAAKIYGKDLGHGVYGASDESASFTIGRKQITIAHDNAPKAVNKVRVYREDKLVRTMNTSMGMHSGTYSGGHYIDFHTMNGSYTVLQHDDPAIMSSASYGLAATDPGGYAPEKIYYATKISTDGIYLHYLDTEPAQNSGVDVSHGCLNLNHPNAVWFYNHSLIGDPVQISGTHGPTIDVAQGGDWSVSWKQWTSGSITQS